MKVLFLGSSQIKHIEKVFLHFGYEIINPNNKYKGVLRKFETLYKLLKCDMIYFVSGTDISKSAFLKLAVFLKKKIIVHWIGTDVLTYTKRYNETQTVINKDCINLAGSDLLQRELRQIGIESKVVPIVPTDFAFRSLEMPEKHAVLAYIPANREEFYNMPLLKKVAKHFSNLDFHIVANSGENDSEKLPNVYYHGYLNAEQMNELYKKCSILFRFPEHDGLSMMLLEALGYGKSVIYRYEFPFAEYPKDENFESIVESFEKILSENPKVNQDAVNFINTEFSLKKQIQRYKDAGVLS
jgi:glycosyltransferase involved in cell wall biosynthesis